MQVDALSQFKDSIALTNDDYKHMYQLFNLSPNQTLHHVKKYKNKQSEHADPSPI
jgi:hypothetical protein